MRKFWVYKLSPRRDRFLLGTLEAVDLAIAIALAEVVFPGHQWVTDYPEHELVLAA